MPRKRLEIDVENELHLDECEARLGISYSRTVNYLIEYVFEENDFATFDQYAFDQLEEEVEPEEAPEERDLFRATNEEEVKTFDDVMDDIDSLGEKQ